MLTCSESITDLEDVFGAYDKALQTVAGTGSTTQDPLDGLARELYSRVRKCASITESSQVIAQQEAFLQTAPTEYLALHLRHGFLGDLYELRSEQTEHFEMQYGINSGFSDLEDLEKAYKHWRAAIALTTPCEARSIWLSRMGSRIVNTYYDTRLPDKQDPGRLDEAVAYHEEALQGISRDHPEYPIHVSRLSIASVHRSKARLYAPVEGMPLDPFIEILRRIETEPVMVRRRFVTSNSTFTLQRFESTKAAGDTFFYTNRELALQGYARALELLIQLAWVGTDVQQQRKELVSCAGGITSDAVACCIQYGHLEGAVEFVDQGRSVIWQSALQIRMPLGDLEAAQPVMAQQLQAIANELQGLEAGDDARRRTLATQWEQLVGMIRSIPGFSEFTQPKRFHDLAKAAAFGPVVIVNVSSFRCDALIISSESEAVRHVPLLDVSHRHIEKLLLELRQALVTSGRDVRDAARHWQQQKARQVDGDSTLSKILAFLWDFIVYPIIYALGIHVRCMHFFPSALLIPLIKLFKRNVSGTLPRLFWCPLGPLASFPLHAAGKNDVNVMDFVVSSYITNPSSLLRASLSKSLIGAPHVLIVAQSDTPGSAPLPMVPVEVDAIRRSLGDDTLTILSGPEATVQKVEDAMPHCQWVHFACHGVQDGLNSRFMLHDAPLSLERIMKRTIRNADLAFLSACQTASVDTQVPDEAIHFAGGLLFTGFRSVVATLWSINDDDGPEVAGNFYSKLREQHSVHGEQAAFALHHAVQIMRVKNIEPMRWIPFIHVGL